MSIPIYTLSNMSTTERERIMKRSFGSFASLRENIQKMVMDVKENGEKPIFKDFAQRNISVTTILVSQTEIKEAYKKVSPKFLRALKQASSNITKVHEAQLQALAVEKRTTVAGKDIQVWRTWRPIERVGVYVPGSRANYPSSLLMTVIPAKIAGCKEIVVCVPPNETGTLPPEVIVAAQSRKIRKLYKIGGPYAIAAMAYGTATVPKVDKIVGPGSQYVTAAKLIVYPTVDIDMPAGPSENLIIADDSANPTFVAADLLTDLEHGADSTGILVTSSESLAKKVEKQINVLLKELPTADIIKQALSNFSAIIVTTTLEEAITFSNEYAPEHMQVMTRRNSQVVKQIKNAGSIFLGNWTSKSSGDYATGANHVLPTGQMARMFSPLSVENFGKFMQVQKVTKKGLGQIRRTIETFADVERFPAHKLSTKIRFRR